MQASGHLEHLPGGQVVEIGRLELLERVTRRGCFVENAPDEAFFGRFCLVLPASPTFFNGLLAAKILLQRRQLQIHRRLGGLQCRAPSSDASSQIRFLLGPLQRLALPIGRILSPRARVILSGLLATQANAALAAYRRQGLSLERRIPLDRLLVGLG